MSNLRNLEKLDKTINECYSKHLKNKFNLTNKLDFSSCIDNFTSNIKNSVVLDHSNIMKNYFMNSDNKLEDHNMIFNNMPKHDE